ncbi:putative transposase of the Rover4 hAT-like family [Lachancea sp. 'fantastica']|nr:putative transposase of the Rover4 hAT-like family [Lachancea sp. 'fantastica']
MESQPIVIQSMDDIRGISRSASTEPGNSSVDTESRHGTLDKLSKSPKASGWLSNSNLHGFFEFPIIQGRKFAQCLYCGKQYPAGESRGNLSKHVRNAHPEGYKKRNNRGKRSRTLEAFGKRSNALRVSRAIEDEYKKNPESFQSVMLVVEGFLPFSWVELDTWGIINSTRGSNFIQSKSTLVKKLDLYATYMEDCLASNLKDTHLVNVLLDVWTASNGESFLAIMVSFVPNIFNETTLRLATDPSIFFDRSGKAQNTHLLDVQSLGTNRYTAKYTHASVSSLLEKHKLLDKVATLTMDNAENNGSFYSHLLDDTLKLYKPTAHRLFRRVRYIRCASHVLNLQFQKLFDHLHSNRIFADAYAKIVKMATIMRSSTRIATSLRNSKIPFIPLDCPTKGMLKWHQIQKFLANRSVYAMWCKKLEEMGDAKFAAKLQKYLIFDSRTTHLLKYFVETCGLFNTIALQLQQDDYNCLSSGVSFYYLLDHYYRASSQAAEGAIISESSSAINFSHLNGSSALHPEDKELVLEAMAHAQESHLEYFSEVQTDPIYCLSVLLDPRLKTEKLHRIMYTSEANQRIRLCELFIKNYFKEYESVRPPKEDATGVKPTQDVNHNVLDFDKQKLAIKDLSSSNEQRTDGNMVQTEEWINYLGEPLLAATSREAAITWWFDRRLRYPRLFKLAMSLFYTKISTCDVKKCLSLADKVMQKKRKRSLGKDVRTSMVLRDRFQNFNFYKTNESSSLTEEHDRGASEFEANIGGSDVDT